MAKNDKALKKLFEDALMPVEEQPYQVPDNWVWSRFGSVCKLYNGYAFKSSDYVEDGIAVIRISDIDPQNTNVDKAVRVPESQFNERYVVKKGDFLIAMSGATTGKYGIYNSDELALQNQRVGNIKVLYSNLVRDKYKNYFMINSRDKILDLAYGGAQPNISSNLIESLEFPIPPLAEQKRMVTKIESLFSKIDKAKELIEEAREDFENRKAAILTKAFSGELTEKWRREHTEVETVDLYLNKIKTTGEKHKKSNELSEHHFQIPETWEWVNIEDISTLITKGASPNWQGINYVEDNSQVLFITSENVREGYIDLSKEKYLELEFNLKQKRSILEYGDVLVNIVGASIGRAAIYELNKVANINQAVSIIRLKDKSINRYLNYFLNSSAAKDYYFQNKVDVARANLSLKDVANIPLPFPPIEEQKEIIRILDNLLEKEAKIEGLTQLEEQVELLKKSILSKAFRGELGTNDPTDESALELLKEILREKTK